MSSLYLKKGLATQSPPPAGVDVEGAQRRAVEELAAREEWHRMILESSPDLVATHDSETAFLYVSGSCRRLLGYAPEEILGRSLLSFVHEEDLARLGPVLTRLRAGSDLETTTCRYRRKDGTYVW